MTDGDITLTNDSNKSSVLTTPISVYIHPTNIHKQAQKYLVDLRQFHIISNYMINLRKDDSPTCNPKRDSFENKIIPQNYFTLEIKKVGCVLYPKTIFRVKNKNIFSK